MTDHDLDPRLRAALEPTAHDVALADSLVDRVLFPGADTRGHRRARSAGSTGRRRWVAPVAAASAAAVLALGVGLANSWVPKHTNTNTHTAATNSVTAPPAAPQHVDMGAWRDEAYPTVSWARADLFEPPLVVVRVASCPGCGVTGALAPIVSSAKTHPDTRFLVVLQGGDMREAGDLNTATALPNLEFLFQGATARLPGEPSDGKTLEAPALVIVSPESTVTSYAYGSDAVEEALASLPE